MSSASSADPRLPSAGALGRLLSARVAAVSALGLPAATAEGYDAGDDA